MSKVILTASANDYNVEVSHEDTSEIVWQGQLEDAIMTARTTAEEIDAENANDWVRFSEENATADMDELSTKLLATESAEEYRWAFEPACLKSDM